MKEHPTPFQYYATVPARIEIIPGFSVIMASNIYPLTEETADGYIAYTYSTGIAPLECDVWYFKIINAIVPPIDLNLLNIEFLFRRFINRLAESVPDWTCLERVHLNAPFKEQCSEHPIRTSRWGMLLGVPVPTTRTNKLSKLLEVPPIQKTDYVNIWAASTNTVFDNSDYIPDWIRDEVSFWLSRLSDFPHYDKAKVELAMALWLCNHEGTERHLECIQRELPAIYALYVDIQQKGEPYITLAGLSGLIQQQDYNSRLKCHNILLKVKVARYDDDCHNPQSLMASMYAAVDIYEELTGYTWDRLSALQGDISAFCRRHQMKARDQLTDVPKKWG